MAGKKKREKGKGGGDFKGVKVGGWLFSYYTAANRAMGTSIDSTLQAISVHAYLYMCKIY